MAVELRWEGGFRFEGVAGPSVIRLDGDGEDGPSPTNLLLQSIGACAGCDVVEILRKGRQDIRSLTVHVDGRRREEPPRYFTRLEVEFVIRGEVERAPAERAAGLSFKKYCSVFHTLRPDLDLDWKVTLA